MDSPPVGATLAVRMVRLDSETEPPLSQRPPPCALARLSWIWQFSRLSVGLDVSAPAAATAALVVWERQPWAEGVGGGHGRRRARHVW